MTFQNLSNERKKKIKFNHYLNTNKFSRWVARGVLESHDFEVRLLGQILHERLMQEELLGNNARENSILVKYSTFGYESNG